MSTDFRALCDELADKLAACWPSTFDPPDCLNRARAALAEPVAAPAGPTDEELDRLEHHHWEETRVEEWGRREAIFNHRSYARAVLARWGHPAMAPAEPEISAEEAAMIAAPWSYLSPPPPAEGEVAELVAALQADAEYARAVLARYGHQPAPAEGEVAELVRWLRRSAGCADESQMDLRAAELLEQRHPAPVPVNERLPGPEDCDAEGRCWWWDGEWGLVEQRFTDYHATHWLPATALPLPQGEVE